ncbi:hypothetical protein B0H66DRAFT_626355, partial [Apodospora peruviana]
AIASSPELSSYYGLYTVWDATSASTLTSVLPARGAASSHQYDILSLDLTKRDNIRQVTERINAQMSARQIPPIRALILNAGLQDFGKQSWTDDGVDVSFAANYLSHSLLTLLLLESMDKEAVPMASEINATSGAYVEEKYKTLVDGEANFEAIDKGTWSSAEEDHGFR